MVYSSSHRNNGVAANPVGNSIMTKFNIIGGEYIDPSIPESAVTFSYTLFASSVDDAKEKFSIVFPSCWIVSIK